MDHHRWAVVGMGLLLNVSVPVFAVDPQGAPPRPSSPASADQAAERLPVPAWLAWRVFHQGLDRQRTTAGDDAVATALRERFQVSDEERAALLAAGDAFLQSVLDIDRGAEEVASATLGAPPAGRRAPPPGPSRPPEGATAPPARRPSTTSMRQRAIDSGLYEQVEGRKRAELQRHLQALRGALSGDAFRRIEQFVSTTVAAGITVVDPRTPSAYRPPQRSVGDDLVEIPDGEPR